MSFSNEMLCNVPHNPIFRLSNYYLLLKIPFSGRKNILFTSLMGISLNAGIASS